MARALYGCTSADFTLTAGGRLSPGAVLTIWSARTGGTRITDLLTVDGTPITEVVSGSDASIAYQGPDNDKSVHWADSGQGARTAIRPVDITGEPNSLSVGTVTTGAAGSSAAVTITGDAPSQTMNLTIPQGATGPAGASVGVLTTKGDLLVRDSGAGTRLPVGSDGKALVADSAQATGVKWDWAGPTNLLSANNASFETSVAGVTTFLATKAQVADASGDGSYVCELVGQASVSAAGFVSVTGLRPGQPYTGFALVKSSSAETQVRLMFYNGGASLAAPVLTVTHSGSGGYEILMVSGVAPATATDAYLFVYTGASGNTVRLDKLGIWEGIGGQWAAGWQSIRPTGWIEGAGSPSGRVRLDRAGVPYIDRTNNRWWISTGATATSWRQQVDTDALPVNVLTAAQADFETAPTGLIAYQATTAVVAGGTSGSNCLRVTSTGASSAIYLTRTITPGDTWTASADIKSGVGSHVKISYYNGGSEVSSRAAYHSGSGDFETVEVSLAAPASGVDTMYVWIYCAQSSGTIDVDRFGVWPGPGGAWAPSGKVAQGAGIDRLRESTRVWDGSAMRTVHAAPRIVLPASITAVVGDTLQLFHRGMVEAPEPSLLPVKVACVKGAAFPRHFEWTPAAGDSGTSQTLTVTTSLLDGGGASSGTTSIDVVTAANPPSMKRVMVVGDSLTSTMVWPEEAYRRLTQSGGTPAGHGFGNFEFIGNTAFPNFSSQKGFGYGGWSWSSYTNAAPIVSYTVTATSHGKDSTDRKSIWSGASSTWVLEEIIDANTLRFNRLSGSGALSSGTLTWSSGGTHTASITYSGGTLGAGTPFWTGSAFSIKHWCDTYNAGVGPDVVVCLLGWNSMLASNAPLASDYWNSYSTSVVYHARVFADTLHAEYPSAKLVVMGLPGPSVRGGLGANYGATGQYADYYNLLRTANGYNLALKKWAAESAYSGWLRYAHTAAQFDADYAYPSASVAVNSRSAVTASRDTNGIHPDTPGSMQIADVAYREIVRALS